MSDYKLVPVEPTEEMLMACYHPQIKKAERAELYRTMLAAAPQVQQEPVAWMGLCDGVAVQTALNKDALEDIARVHEWDVVPLYAAPPAERADDKARQDRIMTLADEYARCKADEFGLSDARYYKEVTNDARSDLEREVRKP